MSHAPVAKGSGSPSGGPDVARSERRETSASRASPIAAHAVMNSSIGSPGASQVVARNRCRNELARRRPVPLGELPDVPDLRSPERAASEAELFRQLDAALGGLPFEQRSAFVLSQMQGLSYEEVARIEGVGVGTVKSRIARAREKLRSLLRHAAEPQP